MASTLPSPGKPTAPFVHLSGANLSGTVLENLKTASPAQAFISDALNAALKSRLISAATAAKQDVLVNLLKAMPGVDIATNKDTSLHDFVSKEVTLPTDPSAKAAAEAAITKLSTKTTVGDLLNLNNSLRDNPLFTSEVNKSDLGALLGTSPKLADPQLQDDFINLYANFKRPIQDFWAQLSQDPKFKDLVPEIQLTLQLGLLTLNNPSLVAAVRAKFKPTTARDLTSLSADDLTQLITSKNIAVPNAISSPTPAERTANYVKGILGVLKGAFSTDYIAQGIAQTPSTPQNPTQLVALFLKNSPDFNFLTTNTDAYATKNSEKAFQGIPSEQRTAVVNSVKAYQRLARVSTDFSVIKALREAGLDSAYRIAMTPRQAFVLKFSDQLGGASQAATIHAAAQHIMASALSLFANVRTALDVASPMVVGDVATKTQAALEAAGIPNWQTLFGSLSYCSCEDCRSVLSPAAYFVDLLQFLKGSPTAPKSQGYTPLDILIGSADGNITGRRPDLPYIKLNCENTNTPLPYVDLVNEILETFVAESASANPPKHTLDKAAAHDTSRDANADQLSVNPEYTNASAYSYLKTSVYPTTLPFDRWLETARTYLDFLGTSLYEVMSTFQENGDPSDVTKGTPSGLALACEYLNISEAEYTILTGKDFSGTSTTTTLPEYYGYGQQPRQLPGWKRDVAKVPNFLLRTGITYDDLVALLKTRFLNLAQSIVLQAPDDHPCDLTVTAIVDLSSPAVSMIGSVLQDSTLDRMHRFIRLWKKLGWTIPDLDKAMTALSASDIDQKLIVSISQVQQLLAALNVPLVQLLSFWANIDTDGRNSLWIQLFQNKAVVNPPDTVFQLKYVASLPSLPTISFPSPLFPNVQYDSNYQLLTFIVNDPLPLVDVKNELTRLLSLSTDSNYTSAINGFLSAGLPDPVPIGKYFVHLASLPIASFPSISLPNFVTYDRKTQQLSITGTMTSAQQSQLLGLSLDANYQTAIYDLYSASLTGGGATYTVPLAALPGFVNYDAVNRQISFVGAMSDEQRAWLNFTNDPAFQIAIDDLHEMRTLSGAEVAPAVMPDRLSDCVNTISAALRLNATDLDALRKFTGMIDPQALGKAGKALFFRVTVPNLTVLHRYSLLARSLNLSITDLISLIILMGGGSEPFGSKASDLFVNPSATLAFVKRVQQVQASPFSISQLNYLYRDLYDPNGGIAPLPANVKLLLTTLQAGLAKIAQENAVVPDPKGDLLRKKLAVLLGGPSADAAMGLINATAAYSAPLAAIPTITLLTFVTYDAVAKQLSMTRSAAMNSSQLGQLLLLSPDTDYQSAVNNLYAASNRPQYSVQVGSLSGTTWPSFVTYAGGQLTLNTGTGMKPQQESALLALSSDPQYQSAIESLYASSQSAAYSVPLDRLPDLLSLFLDIPINYERVNQELILTGPLLPDQTTQLVNLSTDTNYETAVTTLARESSSATTNPLYTYSLVGLPAGVVMPSQLKGVIAYDPTGQQLRFTGSMTDDEQKTLLNVSSDPNYKAAINSLYQQPRDYISQNLSSFLDPTDAVTQLIENAQGLDAVDKFSYVMQRLMPYLRQTLSQALIKQTLSSNLQLDPKLTDLLLGTVLYSQTNPGKANAMADFLALAGDGLSAAYFANQTLTGTPAMACIDQTVNFNWGFGNPTAPTAPVLSQAGGGSLSAVTYYVKVTYTTASGETLPSAESSLAVAAGNVLQVASPTIAAGVTGWNVYVSTSPGTETKQNSSPILLGTGWTEPTTGLIAGTTVGPSRPFSVRWAGFVFPQYTETYTLYVRAGGGVKLWVSDALILDHQSDQSLTEYSGMIALTAGQLASIKLEYYDGIPSAVAVLSWSSPSTPKAVIPKTQLFSGTVLTSLVPIANSYLLLFKAALLAKTFAMTADDLAYLTNHSADFANFDLNLLPLNRADSTAASIDANAPALLTWWERLNALFSFRNNLPGGDAGLLNIFSIASAKPIPSAAPALSQVAGGALPPATYYIKVTYNIPDGEPLPSAESSLLVTASNLLQVASPATVAGATGWNVYVSTSSGTETKQNTSPLPLGTAWTEPATGIVVGAKPPSTALAVLQATGWDAGELEILSGANGFALSDQDFTNETGTKGIGLVQLGTAMKLVSRLGVSSKQLFAWSNLGADPTTEPGIAQDIVNTVKTKYDDTTWPKVGKPLNDKVREESKEALIAYILANASAWGMTASDGGPITTSDQLYEYFLIDVDMSPCMMTSRIVQANAAIQLFAQRCLMNLENGNSNPAFNVSPSAIDSGQWEWRKNYRVWQANREVFLYPENWIFPELRDGKTTFFQELENELMQKEINADNVEEACLNYLNKLDEVARLDIRATYWQFDLDDATASGRALPDTNDVLHVFGRTGATPQVYYYRRLLNCSNYGIPGGGARWTPWEKIDVDIQGDHLIPAVWNRRLYLFWPIFQEVPTNPSKQDYMKTLKINLAWSEYKQGRWSKKQISSDYLTPPGYDGYPTTLDTSTFLFSAWITPSDSLNIDVLQANTLPQVQQGQDPLDLSNVGEVTFASDASSPSFTSPSPVGSVKALVPESSYFTYETLTEYESAGTSTTSPPIGSKVSSFTDNDGGEYVCYVSTDQHVHLLFYNNTYSPYWNDQDLTSAAQGPLAVVQSSISGFAAADGPQVYYIATDQHVHQLWYNNAKWVDQDLANLTKGPSAATGTGITSFAISAEQDVFYISADQHVHRLWYNLANWADQDLTGLTDGVLAAAGSGISSLVSSFGIPGSGPRVYYVAANQHVRQLRYDSTFSQWVAEDLTSAGGSMAAAVGTDVSSLDMIDGQHVYYVAADKHVHQLSYSDPNWNDQDLTNATQGPQAAVGTGISSLPLLSEQLVYYIAADQHVHQLRNNVTNWADQDLTGVAVGAGGARRGPLAAAGTGVSGVSVAVGFGQSQQVYYVANDQHVHQLGYAFGTLEDQDLTSLTRGPLAAWVSTVITPGIGNQLVLVSGTPTSSSPPAEVPTLGQTPTLYDLVFPEQFFPSFGLQPPSLVPGPFIDLPFFYQDAQRTYFVTEAFADPRVVLADPNGIGATYSPAQLITGPRLGGLGDVPVFETGGPQLSTSRGGRNGGVAVRSFAALATGGSTGRLGAFSTGSLSTPWGDMMAGSPQVTFSVHDHPQIRTFIKTLNSEGVPGLLTLATQQSNNLVNARNLFDVLYQPNIAVVTQPYPDENVDFSYAGAYSIYNWELFFHIPLLIATRLSQNQKFAEAQKWFHYIFNPTTSSEDPIPSRYWNVLPFYQDTEDTRIEDLLALLDYTGNDPVKLAEKTQVTSEIAPWSIDPFNPHLIARMRLVAYQKTVVLKYIDNLIAWGDFLFRQNTRESINEATQIYVLAQEILGTRPTEVPQRGTIQDYTYHDLTTLFGLDDFSNTLVLIENQFPFTTAGSNTNSGGASGISSAAGAATTSFYFCIPPNDQLLTYWDTVADRLYKIRHCMNIAGAVEQLPLFSPPISPALLVQAAAMGVDLGSVLSDINAPAPNYRFTYMLQKTIELCSEVRSLGSTLLAALEKKDAEHLAFLRSSQETGLLKAVRDVRQRQFDEANKTVEGLQKSKELAQIRQGYYTTLLSAASTLTLSIPTPDGPSFSIPLLPMNEFEVAHLLLTGASLVSQAIQAYAEFGAAVVHLAPDVKIGAPTTDGATYGGSNIGSGLQAFGGSMGVIASMLNTAGSAAATLGSYKRRAEEWDFQKRLADKELEQIQKQIDAANIRATIAQKELDNQDLQIQNAQDVQDFLQTKFTAEELYSWMVDQTSAIFFQCYQLAYETAKKTEKAFQFELGLVDSNHIQFGYWDSLKKGLLAGEQLYTDLKRMELAYVDSNVREYEISKNISLVLLNPLALIALKETGQCVVDLPEALFDMDYPGVYMRRIKSVSLTIPCVTGPYTNINCTLTLLSSKIRVDNIANSAQDYGDDSHFITNFAATQSIATSSAQNDSGMFELNFRDERYLPFEGAGVISTWRIDLPLDTNAFDFETISDVVINLKYTARDGGAVLAGWAKKAAVMPVFSLQTSAVDSSASFPDQANLLRFFSLKHEFPSEWYKFLNPPVAAGTQSMQIALTMDRFPYQYRGKKIRVSRAELLLKFKELHDPKTYAQDGTPLGDYANGPMLVISLTPPLPATGQQSPLVSSATVLNGLPVASIALPSGSPPGLGNWTLTPNNTNQIPVSLQNVVTSGANTYHYLDPTVIDDIVMVCHYSAKPK